MFNFTRRGFMGLIASLFGYKAIADVPNKIDESLYNPDLENTDDWCAKDVRDHEYIDECMKRQDQRIEYAIADGYLFPSGDVRQIAERFNDHTNVFRDRGHEQSGLLFSGLTMTRYLRYYRGIEVLGHIERIAGPTAIVNAFLAQYSDVCKAVDNNPCFGLPTRHFIPAGAFKNIYIETLDAWICPKSVVLTGVKIGVTNLEGFTVLDGVSFIATEAPCYQHSVGAFKLCDSRIVTDVTYERAKRGLKVWDSRINQFVEI